MAFPTQRGSVTSANISVNSEYVEVGKPTGVVSGDTLVIVININNWWVSDGSFKLWSNSDFELVGHQTGTDSGSGETWNRTSVYKRIANGSEGSVFAFTAPAGEPEIDESKITCIAFSGSAGVGASTSSESGALSVTWTSPDLTTTAPDSLVLRAWTKDADGGMYGSLTAYTSGLSEVYDAYNNYTGIALTLEEKATAGATGTKTATRSASQGAIHFAVEIKAAPAANDDEFPQPLPGALGVYRSLRGRIG